MTRTFPLAAVFAILATLCLSTTSAIPFPQPDGSATPSTTQCIQEKWEMVKPVLNAVPAKEKGRAPFLFDKDGNPIAKPPNAEQIESAMSQLNKDERSMFLTYVQCQA
ncbi:hypothetical protein BG015_008695 [Linnemannia schmuckeri]|uniref:Uncharacterized protein n=1 Tax=Linnemannia schmuckeri TaxID=64567 RepID=A0A9P5VES8_9FUNG|nr:hypothetical protein BG015_008695 [Linnemannia schmuckeri]